MFSKMYGQFSLDFSAVILHPSTSQQKLLDFLYNALKIADEGPDCVDMSIGCFCMYTIAE